MKRVDESRAIRAALLPDTLADYFDQCHVVSTRLVEAAETKGSPLSKMWRRARVARGRHAFVPMGHSWVVVDEKRIVDVTVWGYDPQAQPIHRTHINDPAYQEAVSEVVVGNCPECDAPIGGVFGCVHWPVQP